MKPMGSNSSNKEPDALSNAGVAELNNCPTGNARRVSGVDRGLGIDRDIKPYGAGEYDQVLVPKDSGN